MGWLATATTQSEGKGEGEEGGEAANELDEGRSDSTDVQKHTHTIGQMNGDHEYGPRHGMGESMVMVMVKGMGRARATSERLPQGREGEGPSDRGAYSPIKTHRRSWERRGA